MATSTENSGILFIYESDGFQWATHIASLLENEPYNIPCATEHWWNLTGNTASFHPVHVLLLSPLMEGNIKHEKFSHLRNESETSLLLECNVDSKDLQMLEWKVIETLDTTLEKQRNILTTLVEMYELETNDNGSFSPDEFLCIDIVPTCLYPGERTIHIMFSIEPQGEVTVRLEGMPKRLPTRKHTKNTYTCEFPETGPGQKITSVYVEGTGYSLYTTKIVIVTADALMENFLENLKNTLGIRTRSHSSRTWHTMGLFFNPFCEYLCPQCSQVYFAERIAEVIAQNKKTQRDSGFSAASDEHFYEMIPCILFIYEEDGLEWTDYLMGTLKGPGYCIPCTSVLWCVLTENLTLYHPVHILVLTPQMESHVSKIEHELLNYSSETSLLLECNTDSSRLEMVNWTVKHRLENSVENQRKLLTTIVQLYEAAVNDAVYDSIALDVNVIPTTIFPGQEEVYIVFSWDQSSEILVKMDGANERLRTRKYSDRIFACDLPQNTCGQKNISVYKKDTVYPICTAKVTVVTVRALLQNLIDNLESAFGISSDVMESGDDSLDKRLTTLFPMGIQFNPFLKAPDETLITFAEQVHKLYTKSLQDDTNRDSGFAQEPKETGEQRSKVDPSDLEGEQRSKVDPSDLEVVQRRDLNRASQMRLFKFFGKRRSNPGKEKEMDNKALSRRISQRMAKAMTETVTDIPQIPKSKLKLSLSLK